MDIFGSNATPMGGGAGRCDAIIGAVEAQKAQGILHLHFFMYIQTLLQFLTLQEIADKLRDGIVTSENWKEYVSYVRCAAYPDAEKAERDRSDVEKHGRHIRQWIPWHGSPQHFGRTLQALLHLTSCIRISSARLGKSMQPIG